MLGVWGADPETPVPGMPWFRFESNGKFNWYDGCNQVGGKWTFDPSANAIRIGAFGTTEVGCSPAVGVSVTTMTFDGDRITYTLGSGQRKSLLARTH
ncbi:MAG: hypothetical protein JWR83_306 [Aeromicrobium sp.]|nr:hypothetical protein [Aeromicrobium sp.]